MTKDVCREEMSKFAALSGFIYLIIIITKLLFNNNINNFKTSMCILGYHLHVNVLSDEVDRVNSSGPRTEPWETPQNKGIAFEKHFLMFID